MDKLCDEAREITLREGYSTFVWGEGPSQARNAIIGEAPGAEEVREGRPFVGRAGRLLRAELSAANFEPDKCWITNVVKHRPTKGSANRPPNVLEIDFWLPILVRELSIVNPSHIICLGGVAAKAMLMEYDKMSKWRGKWFELPSGVRLMVTYHPSYVIRALAFKDQEIVRNFRRDLAVFASECPR